MKKMLFSDYRDELAMQRRAWQAKPGLRWIYHQWYARIVEQLALSPGRTEPMQPVVELGAGCGSFKAFYPKAIATDVHQSGDWIDEIVDARCLPWEAASIGNIVMIDCLHHLVRPIRFLQAAEEVLVPGGRLVLLEPAATPWARWFWKRFHHEPVDTEFDFAARERLDQTIDAGEPDNLSFLYANMGTAHRLFATHWADTRAFVAGMSIVRLEWSDCIVYPLTGGFSYRSYVPSCAIPLLYWIERSVLRPTISRHASLRMLVVLEKQSST